MLRVDPRLLQTIQAHFSLFASTVATQETLTGSNIFRPLGAIPGKKGHATLKVIEELILRLGKVVRVVSQTFSFTIRRDYTRKRERKILICNDISLE